MTASKPVPALSWQDQARFWSKVAVDHKDVCWLWRDSVDAHGYGAFRIDGRITLKAHRIAYSLAHNDAIADSHMRHACDNPPCCNPFHLLTGTQAENMADCISRCRNAFGARIPNAKLNDEQASSIWGMKGALTAVAVGRMFGVAEATVRNIWYRKTWKHIHTMPTSSKINVQQEKS